MSLKLNVEVSAGVYETIKTYSKAIYEVPLNKTRWFDIVVEGGSANYRTDFALNRKVLFYFGGTLEMKGVILKRTHLSGGMMRLEGMGYGESQMGKPQCADQAFTATNTSGVVDSDTNNLLSLVSVITGGTLEDQTVNNFRTDVNQTPLQGLGKLCELTGQDFSFDDVNDELDVEDHKGSASTVATLVDGVSVKGVTSEEDDVKTIKKITVIGKGFGANQITSSSADGWTQGDGERTHIDKSVDTAQEAADLATKLLAIEKATRYSYSFEVLNPFFSFTLGDVVTLKAERIGVSGTNLRTIKYKRVSTPTSSKLFLTVRGTGEREAKIDQLRIMAAQNRTSDEARTMSQPTGTGALSLTGQPAAANAVVTGTVSTAGASETSYTSAVYTASSLTGDNSWITNLSTYTTGAYTYFYHVAYGFFTLELGGGAGTSWACDVKVRLYNNTIAAYFPSSAGIELVGGFSMEGDKLIGIPFHLIIPYNWTSDNYEVQYLIQNQTNWGTYQTLHYAYYGTRGHGHGDNFAGGGHATGIGTLAGTAGGLE